MPFSPIPRGVYPSVTSLDPKKLKEKGITLVLADLDNTLVPYKVLEPSNEVAAWMAALKEEGIDLFLLSNSRKPGRAQKFAQQVGIPYQGHSGKPKKAGYLKAMERMGRTPQETVMVGDQIFTDPLGANRAGVTGRPRISRSWSGVTVMEKRMEDMVTPPCPNFSNVI